MFGFGTSKKKKSGSSEAAEAEAAKSATTTTTTTTTTMEGSVVIVSPPSNPPPPTPPPKSSEPGYRIAPGSTALVTGSTGFCGARLVEMLLERGAKLVVAMDLVVPDDILSKRFDDVKERTGGSIILRCGSVDGDITNYDSVQKAFESATTSTTSTSASASTTDDDPSNKKKGTIDAVYHIAALVGPFHEDSLYYKVNVGGTENIIRACREYGVYRLVNSSSPSTRFTGQDVEGLREDQMRIPPTFLARYAETKAIAERAVTAANDGSTLLTVSVAPHQVYGPHDGLFFPKLMETMGNGRLRIFGKGRNKISVCHVDNYAHGLLCAVDALRPDSPVLGGYYVVTDDEPQHFWTMVNDAGVRLGFADMFTKFHLPVWLLYTIAYACNVVGFVFRKKFKLNPFNVRMLTIHRYFNIENAKRDLHYAPIYTFEQGWTMTIEWFRVNWLPRYLEENPKAKANVEQQQQQKKLQQQQQQQPPQPQGDDKAKDD